MNIPSKIERKLPVKRRGGRVVARYRVVRDCYLGYECQKRRWWSPFWVELPLPNTYASLDAAIKAIEMDIRSREVVME